MDVVEKWRVGHDQVHALGCQAGSSRTSAREVDAALAPLSRRPLRRDDAGEWHTRAIDSFPSVMGIATFHANFEGCRPILDCSKKARAEQRRKRPGAF